MSNIKYFSMFSGIGGFELGIQNAYRGANRGSKRNQTQNRNESETSEDASAAQGLSSTSTTNSSDNGPLCVGYSEIDKYAIKVYERNFIGHTNYGDATAINPHKLPDFDLLVGGFPCQAFSIAGKRAGFNDTRGTLFFDIARILKEKQPRHLVLENVKGLLSHDSGRTFTTIIGVLTDLGYLVEWQVLNSKDFGVPQNRERVYIVGHLGNRCRGKVFPIGQDGSRTTQGKSTLSGEIQTEEPRRDSRHTDEQIFQNGENGYIHQLNQPKHSNERVYADTGISPTLNTMQGGNRQPFIAAINAVNKGEKVRQQGRRIKNHEEPTFTLNTIDQVGVTDGVRIRRLTPKECERLQGFPDDWTKEGVELNCEGNFCKAGKVDACLGHFEEISDTQRYKMCGNAVTVNTVQAVMERLIPCLK